ncbi:MAG: hypothetical protein JNL52_02055 [Flavobacteriales bacterium]|nr:hypothetical protein [Flavobacteriales bacterium]
MIAQLLNWHWSRWLRAGVALAFAAQAVFGDDAMAFIPAAFFGAQAVFNLGCGMNGCSTPQSKTAENEKAVEYTEIRSAGER